MTQAIQAPPRENGNTVNIMMSSNYSRLLQKRPQPTASRRFPLDERDIGLGQ